MTGDLFRHFLKEGSETSQFPRQSPPSSCNPILHLIWIKPALWIFQTFELGLGSIWSKKIGLSWSHREGGFSWLSWNVVFWSQSNVLLKTGIKVRWIRWSWIAKHGIYKSRSIWSRLHFFLNGSWNTRTVNRYQYTGGCVTPTHTQRHRAPGQQVLVQPPGESGSPGTHQSN